MAERKSLAHAVGGQRQNMNLPPLVFCHKNLRKQLFQATEFTSAAICSGRASTASAWQVALHLLWSSTALATSFFKMRRLLCRLSE